MARNGFKIFDSDTHVGPAADILERYLSKSEKQKLESWERYKLVNSLNGHVEYTFGRRNYRRKLGSAGPEPERPRTTLPTGNILTTCRCRRRRSIRRSESKTWIGREWMSI